MKIIRYSYFIVIFFLFIGCKEQRLPKSGIYSLFSKDLKVSYNPQSKTISGYFASYRGLDESGKNPKFSCEFYFKSISPDTPLKIISHHPKFPNEQIIGELSINSDRNIKISLEENHGGCWNIQPFDSKPVTFRMDSATKWLEVRYVIRDKVHFHSSADNMSQTSAYLLKGDIVYINKKQGKWLQVTYDGKSISTGWLRMEDLNEI